jgi:hypothetical protein
MHLFRSICFLLTFLPAILFSQGKKINWSSDQFLPYNEFQGQQMAGSKNDRFYYIHEKGKNWTILTYDLTNSLVNEATYTMMADNKPLQLIRPVQTTAGTYIIGCIKDSRTDSYDIYSVEFLDNRLSEPRLIFTTPFDEKKSDHKPWPNRDFGLSIGWSEDLSKVVFYNSLSNIDRNKEEALSIAVFNEKLEKQWDKIAQLPMDDKDIVLNKLAVSNDGQIILTGRIINERQLTFALKTFLISANGQKEINLDLKDDDEAVCLSAIFRDGQIILCGFYQTSADLKAQPAGVFFAGYSNEKSVKVVKTPFSKASFTSFNKSADAPDFKDNNLRINEFKVLPNGSYEFVAEYYSEVQPGSYQVGKMYKVVNPVDLMNFHGDLYTGRLDATGKMTHFYQVYRTAFDSKTEYPKYLSASSGDQTFLFYYDYLTKEEKKNLKGFKPYVTAGKMVMIDSGGKAVHHKLLFDAVELGHSFSRINIIQVENKLIFGGHMIKNVSGPGSIHSKKQPYKFGMMQLD